MGIEIRNISSTKLRTGEFRQILPEYYQLSSITENNPWHVRQNVFDHVIAVFAGMEQALVLEFLSYTEKQQITTYLDQTDGILAKNTRKDLLILATLLHDIGKFETLITGQNGTTSCPGHEMIGASMVKKFVSRFDLEKIGVERVEKIIAMHTLPHDILTVALARGDKDKYGQILNNAASEINIELLLLCYADMLGSDLPKSLHEEFAKREKLLIKYLKQAAR